jgi:hypothetical protein
VIDGSCRGARRALIGVLLAAFCLAIPAGAGAATKSASDIAPIVGTWKDGGAVIKVTGGGGSFQGTVVSGEFGACGKGGPGTVVWIGLAGSGFSYSGQIPFVHSDDCSSAGTGPATFTLSNIDHGTWSALSPDGMTYTGSFSRQGTWPGADNGGANEPKTNCKKSGRRVLCPKQKRVVKKAVRTVRKTLAAAKPKAYKKASPQGKSARLQQLVDVSVQAQGLLDDWRKLKLATKNAAAKVYDDPFLNKLQGSAEKSRDAILDNLHRAQDGIAEFNYKLSKLGDKVYDASDGYGPDTNALFSVILDSTAGELYRGICPGAETYGFTDCWHHLPEPQQKASTYSTAFPSLLNTEKTNGPPTTGGRTVSVDPQTGEIVFQLYGSASSTGSNG